MLRILLAICCLVPLLAGAESYEDKLADTNMGDPDEICELAVWCKENRMHTTSAKLFRKALKIDPNHEPTRHAMGFFWNGEKWVHQSRMQNVPEEAGGDGDGGGAGAGGQEGRAVSAGPGPEAEDIEWDPTLPPNPDQAGNISGFMDRYVARLAGGSGPDLYRSVIPTLIQPKYRAVAVSRIAHAFNDGGGAGLLQGASQFIHQMRRKDREERTTANMQLCQRLLPFLAQTAGRVKDTEARRAFASVAGAFGDKRVMPLLIDFLETGDEDLAFSAKGAISRVTMIPEGDVTVENAKAWWSSYHDVSDKFIYGDALGNIDPMIQLNACQRLYPYQDKRIVDTLAALIAGPNINIAMGAARLLKRISGSDWSVTPSTSPEDRAAIARQIRDWWSEEKIGYTFVEFRGAQASAGAGGGTGRVNLLEQWIGQLADPDVQVSEQAKVMLQNQEMKAAPLLVRGLKGGSNQKRQACRDILRVMAKEDFGFDAYDDDEEANAAAIAKWEEWLDGQSDPESGEGGTVPPAGGDPAP